jgi:two-component system response regulator FixJ
LPSHEPKVHVVDDDVAVRDSLRALGESAGLHVALYASAEEFLGAADQTIAGCLLLDIRMVGLSGLDLQQVLQAREIDLPAIIITGHGDVPAATRAFKQGAIDFVEKPFEPVGLLRRIRGALEQNRQERQRRAARLDVTARVARLSAREREVMDLIVAGLANKEIAVRLGIAERTVEFHRAHVMDKTAAGSLLELVQMVVALRRGELLAPILSDPVERRS